MTEFASRMCFHEFEGGLVVVKAFTECGKVLVAVSLCKVGILEFLLC